MTDLIPDSDALMQNLHLAREDIRRLHPLLVLLEPQDRDEMAGFAERLIQFMSDIETAYLDQTREFLALRSEVSEMNRKLRFLVEGV